MKRNAILILLLITTIMLTGCKSIKERIISGINAFSSTVKFTKVAENMNKQTSYQMKTKINLTNGSDKSSIVITNNIDMKNENEGQIEFLVETSYNNSTSKVNGYTSLSENTITTYIYDTTIEKWIKTTMTPEEFQDEELILDFLNVPKIEYSRKEVLDDETKCNVYSLQIDDMSYITSILGENLDILQNLNISEDDLASYMSLIKFEIYVDANKNLIRQIYIDLSEVMFKSSKAIIGITKFDITIELSKFGEVEVDIPLSTIETLLYEEEKPIEPTEPTDPTDPIDPIYPTDDPDQPKEYNNTKTNYKFDTIYEQIQYDRNIIPLSFRVTDSIAHPTKPIIYFVSSTEMALFEVNYSDSSVRKVDFELPPERLTYHNDKIYITLLKGNHDRYWFTEDQEGAIAVVNASSMSIDKLFDIELDPFDIEVNKDGVIFASSGSGQHSDFVSYDEVGLPIEKAGISERSYIKYNKKFNKIYTINTCVEPRDMTVFNITNGKFTSAYDTPYHGDYHFNTRFQISPDGKYIFNGSGVILFCSPNREEDMIYKTKLKYAFDDITFDLNNNYFFTSHGNQMLKYDYLSNDILGYYKTNSKISYLHFNNDNIVAIGKDSQNNYYIEIIKE